MRVEARRQQREHEYKLPAEKVENEMKSQAIDGRGPGGKKSKDEMEIRKWRQKGDLTIPEIFRRLSLVLPGFQ
ncbi:hypothetical protein DVH24_034240 [Malus domestica]|uniref:Uncharacterized protein n=1 Tax=Malus domestica TaxID=3750 RepID=A0A498KP41_MALDO|nr:hypothetical protein DVH24_034240 [Malus domestica]